MVYIKLDSSNSVYTTEIYTYVYVCSNHDMRNDCQLDNDQFRHRAKL